MLRRLIIMILEIKKDLESAHVGAYAAQSAYFIILSFLPLTIMLLSLVQFTGVGKADLYNLIQTVIPLGFRSWVIGMVDEMYSRTIATISLSALVMVWSAGKSFMALNRGICIDFCTACGGISGAHCLWNLHSSVDQVSFSVSDSNHADSAYVPSVDHVGLIYGIFCSALYDAAKP